MKQFHRNTNQFSVKVAKDLYKNVEKIRKYLWNVVFNTKLQQNVQKCCVNVYIVRSLIQAMIENAKYFPWNILKITKEQ